MKLTGKSIANSVSDDRYRAAVLDMQMRHTEEYEQVHDGSGRSEELPSDLALRQARERVNLSKDRDELGVMAWKCFYFWLDKRSDVATQSPYSIPHCPSRTP